MVNHSEVVGNIHLHTTYSDGSGDYQTVIAAAKRQGLDYLVVTDHNQIHLKEEGWRHDVLVLVSEEVNDTNNPREDSHCLCLGVQTDMTPLSGDAQKLIDATNQQGGLSFLAHPLERGSKYVRDTYPWTKWEVHNYTGIELWNYSSTFRPHARTWAHLAALLLFPDYFQTGPLPETLRLWDQLLAQRPPVVAIGGSDCHAGPVHVGKAQHRFLSYDLCFAAVNTHLLLQEAFNGDVGHDKELVYSAISAGHAFVAFDRVGSARGFRFTAQQEGQLAIMGEALPSGTTEFYVTLPTPAEIRLLRDGVVVARNRGISLLYQSAKSGIYRVETKRWRWGRRRGWIYSNPIYVGLS